MFCGRCGTKISDRACFCESCGQPVSTSGNGSFSPFSDQPSAPITVSSCNTKVMRYTGAGLALKSITLVVTLLALVAFGMPMVDVWIGDLTGFDCLELIADGDVRDNGMSMALVFAIISVAGASLSYISRLFCIAPGVAAPMAAFVLADALNGDYLLNGYYMFQACMIIGAILAIITACVPDKRICEK